MDYPTTGGTEYNTINETGVRFSTTTSTQVLAARSTRVYCRITNEGALAYVSLGLTADKTRGIRIGNNETWETDRDNIWRGAINGISNTATNSKIIVSEGYTA